MAAIFRIILDPNMGNLNVILRSLHLDFLAKPWLGDSKYALASVIAINVFTWAGYNMMIYSSTLLSISDEIYESAIIDGAGFWRILTRITLPMVSGTTRMHVILCLIGALKTFDVVFMLTGGGPAHATEFPGTYLYSKALVEYNAGFGASLGVLILIISMIFSIVQTLITNKE